MRLRLDPLAKSGLSVVPPIAPVITGGGSSSSGGVSSVQSDSNPALTGAISLLSGTGASLSQSGNSITISATGTGGGTVTGVSVVSANGFAGTVANPSTTPAISLSTSITGLLKGNGTAISAATAGTDYQSPISLTTTGTSGAATFVGGTLNIPQYAGQTYTAGTGLTLTTNQFSVNTSQNITTLSNLTSNGFVKTSGSNGTLSIDTSTYLTANQSITLSGHVTGSGTTAITTSTASKIILQGTSDSTVPNAQFLGALSTGLLKNTTSTGVLSVASAGTDYQSPISLTTTGTSGNATFTSNTLNIPNYTYTLPTASTSVLGGVKVDGTTITISGGVISSTGSGSGNTTNITTNTTKIDQTPSSGGSFGAITGTVNGTTTTFTVSNGSYASGTLRVFLNGQEQTQGSSYDWVEATPSSGTFTFSVAPPTGSIIVVAYSVPSTSTGNIYQPIATKTANYTIALTDTTILGDATSGSITLALPTASSAQGYTFNVKKVDSSANTVTIDPSGSETIDGASTKSLTAQYQSVTFVSNGTAWFIL